MSLFLSPDELRRATGKRRFKAQCAALDAMGVRYVKAASGEPLVRPDALDSAPKGARNRGPRWDLLNV